MSSSQLARSPDLARLQDEGFDVDLRDGYLIVQDVPYVTSDRQVDRGTIVTAVTFAGDAVQPPTDHTVLFAGREPCDGSGAPLIKVINGPNAQQLFPDLRVDFRFSAKPPEGNYPDFHAKVTTYVDLLSRWARTINPGATAQTYLTREEAETESPFVYRDSASSRVGLTALNNVFKGHRIAIVGLGGTGSYILDLVAKTPVAEIHLFDGDDFLNHNAFRAPGAPELEVLRAKPKKVDHWAQVYSCMRRGVVPHPDYVDLEHIEELTGFDFVFLAVDDGPARADLANGLKTAGVPFIDVGMGVENVDDRLTGLLRVSLSTPERPARIPTGAGAPGEYATNIQIAELNALNASLAVLQWKRWLGFYADLTHGPTIAYAICDNTIAEATQ